MKKKKTTTGKRNSEIKNGSVFMVTSTTKAPIKKNETPKLSLKSKFELPDLPYAFHALEPFIDKKTMEIHHDKHHGTYVNNLNKALEELKDTSTSMEKILKNISLYPMAVRNNCGGHYNHSMFWKLMKSNGGGQPKGKLLLAINSKFGDFENFKSKFNDFALKLFGSGWVWLILKDGDLKIGTTQNQDNPLMDDIGFKGTPILCLDIWEHAYYLKYQNRRADYINSWWNVVNWDEAENNFIEAK